MERKFYEKLNLGLALDTLSLKDGLDIFDFLVMDIGSSS
jgi:hypothetical protein